MSEFRRYAIYYLPAPGALMRAASDWLGWDPLEGCAVPPAGACGLSAQQQDMLTQTPRKYGFHATIKPPFYLTEGWSLDALVAAFEVFCASEHPVILEGLEVTTLGRFLALTPQGDTEILTQLAADSVRALDGFRAPMSAEERSRRLQARLSDRQRRLIDQWGYPYVMEEFRFHMTLTGKADKPLLAEAQRHLEAHLLPLIPRPLEIDGLCLMGEDRNGMFHLIHRAPLGAVEAESGE